MGRYPELWRGLGGISSGYVGGIPGGQNSWPDGVREQDGERRDGYCKKGLNRGKDSRFSLRLVFYFCKRESGPANPNYTFIRYPKFIRLENIIIPNMPEFTREQIEESSLQFSDHISSIRRSDVYTCETAFNSFMNFCETDQVISTITSPLKEIDVQFDDVWNQAYQNGSRKFDIPPDNLRKNAYLYQLCLKIFHNESGFKYIGVGLEYFKSTHVNDNIRSFNAHVIEPLYSYMEKEFRRYQRSWPEQSSASSPHVVQFFGDNSRINVGSVDNSTNIVGNFDLSGFEDIRVALNQIPDPEKRRECVNSLENLKESIGTDSYILKYQKFISTASEHMTLILPFIQYLSGFLSS